MTPGAAAGPDPEAVRPIKGVPSIAFPRPLAAGWPAVEIGAYAHAHEAADPSRFSGRDARHHCAPMRVRRAIGRFCASAEGAVFFMNGANRAAQGFPTYPCEIFGHGWEAGAGRDRPPFGARP